VLLALSVAAPAGAQSSSGFSRLFKEGGVGATVGWVYPSDSDVDVGTVLGFQFGVAPRPGWGPTIGFGWFGSDLLLSGTDVGNLNVKPLMAGIAYTWVHGRVSTWVALNAGVSFNSASVDAAYRDAFGPGTSVDLDVSNSFCVRPSVEVDYAVTRKFALTAFAGYWWTRIDSTLNTPVGRFEDDWNPSSLSASFGFMVYPFR
jgi:hypothetical protein